MTRNQKNQIKILIVEDELLLAEQMAEYLKSTNYTVLKILDNGEDAINFLKEDSPDLILMDIELNGKMDGIETAIKMQESVFIPIIYLSKKNDDQTLHKVKVTLPAAYLTKPFKNYDLRNSIEMAIYKGDMDHQKEARHEIKLNLEIDIQNNDGLKQLQNRVFYRERNGGLRKLLLEEIVYLEKRSQSITVHTISGSFEIQTSLKKFLDQIKNTLIYRIHEQYAINLVYIHQIVDHQIILEFEKADLRHNFKKEQLKLPLSSDYRENFYKTIENQII